MQSPYSKIPSVTEIDVYLADQNMKHGREVRDQVQGLLNDIRQDKELLSDPSTSRETILALIKNRLESSRQELISLINATGTVIHTNLGRSVFSREVFQDVTDIATSYTNLEFSMETGKRGVRLSIVGRLLKTLTGAEEAVIVNNNAAAVLLTLITFAQGKEVVISRGELVEIGGSFRIPDVISVSGAILREIGSTNRTRLSDYEKAINDETAILLKAHTSNYRITGFTETVPAPALSKLAKEKDLILVEDLGSGALSPFNHSQLNSEPMVPHIIRDGIDIVTFSGDKLLGGPQAGIIVGKKKYLEKIRTHPLYRALRCDKLTMLILEKTLVAYIKNKHRERVPTQRMLNEGDSDVKIRAEQVLSGLDDKRFKLVSCESAPGGGSLPGTTIASWGIQLNLPDISENRLLDRLRASDPPVIARIHNEKVTLDCRTVLPHQLDILTEILRSL